MPLWGRWESFWSPGRGGRALVVTAEDAAHGLAYTIANPVAAGQVRKPKAWPGLNTTVTDLEDAAAGRSSMTFTRPKHFFRSKKDGGKIPATVTWSLAPHPLGADDPLAFVADVKRRAAIMIAAKVAQVRASGGRFAGVAAVMKRSWKHTPTTSAPRRTINPRFACRDPELRRRLISDDREELKKYRQARLSWLDGKPALFPAGTNQMKDYPGVEVQRAGPIAA